MSLPPNALAIVDEHGRVQYILGQNRDVCFARHIEEGDTGKIAVNQSSVARNAHVMMHYECTLSVSGQVYLTDVSTTGTFVRLYDAFDTQSTPSHAHELIGVHSRSGAAYAVYTVASFVDSAQARILLGDLYSDTYFQLRDADKLFYDACLKNDTYKAYSLIYPTIADSGFLSSKKIQSILHVCIEMSNIKLLKLLFLIWPKLSFHADLLHIAIINASLMVFKLLLSNYKEQTNNLLNQLIRTAVLYKNLHVVIFIGFCCGIDVAQETVRQVQALPPSGTDFSTMMAFQLFAGESSIVVKNPGPMTLCTSLFVVAFMCMKQINPGYIIRQVQNGKWGACGKHSCDTCAMIVKAASSSNFALLDDIAGSYFQCKLKPRRNGLMYRDHFYSMAIPPVVFTQYVQPFILRQVKTRGLMSTINFPMFSVKGRQAMCAFVAVQHRINCMVAVGLRTNVPAIPIELQYYILSFVRHCDWSNGASLKFS